MPVVIVTFLLAAAPATTRASGVSAQLQPVDGAAQALTLADSSGAPVTLAAHRGRPVLVHFFATWCEPCREELPALARLAARAGDQRLSVLAISVAEVPIRVRRFLEAMPLNFPVLLDQDRAVARAWGVDSLPTTFILDADLKPRLAIDREYDWDKLDLPEILQQLSRRE